MQAVNKFEEWYKGQNTPTNLTAHVFAAARKEFEHNSGQSITLEPNGSNKPASIEDVHKLLQTLEFEYQTSRKATKIKACLASLAARLQYYGNIMDVLASHHPEYTALAWGAMKLLIVGTLNHVKSFTTIVRALSRIGDQLPRVQLAAKLYPTELMEKSIKQLYSELLIFFMRASQWLKASTLKHIIDSIIKPPELRFDDILENIKVYSQNIDNLAISASQAETRDIHNQVDFIATYSSRLATENSLKATNRRLDLLVLQDHNKSIELELRKMREMFAIVVAKLDERESQLTAFQSLQSSAMLDTNQRLADVQFGQIMASLSAGPFPEAVKALRQALFLSRRATRRQQQAAYSLWNTPQLRLWLTSDASGLAILRRSFALRNSAKTFCAKLVEQVRLEDLPVIWVLPSQALMAQRNKPNSMDLLKHLVFQAMSQHKTPTDERSLSLSCRKFQTARTEMDWFEILTQVLSVSRKMFLVIDTTIISPELESSEAAFSWIQTFLNFFNKDIAENLTSTLKVLLLASGTGDSFEAMDTSSAPKVNTAVTLSLKAKRTRLTAQKKRTRFG